MNRNEFIPVPFKRAEEKHKRSNRPYQGIPSITVTPNGRLFAVWYGGGEGEGPENYIMIAVSDDHGIVWSQEEWVVDPPQENIRAFDPALFTDPDGCVHCFWGQCYSSGIGNIFDGQNGVWHSKCENPEDAPEHFRWSLPERISDGVMMNRPVVLSNGNWALPISIWNQYRGVDPVKPPESMIYISSDNGKSFQYRGGVKVPPEFACFDEHSIYELSDGRLGMLIRKKACGYYESFSSDGGKTWTPVELSNLPGADSRGYLGRLASGKHLAIVNDAICRRNLTAFLSDDDGKTWYAKFCFDMRDVISYPDAVQDSEGFIYVIYDRDRYGAGEILCSRFTEADIEAGTLLTPESFAARNVSRLFLTHNELKEQESGKQQ